MKKIADIVCFVIGPFLTVFFIFSFGHRGLVGSEGSNPLYYPPDSKLGIGIGVALICLGILRKHWKKRATDKEISK